MNEVKLKPCPFCGGEAKMISGYGRYGAVCKECAAKTPSADTIDDAAKIWNERKGHQTYRECFEDHISWDAFKEADTEQIINNLCVCWLFGEDAKPNGCMRRSCRDCWDREMP